MRDGKAAGDDLFCPFRLQPDEAGNRSGLPVCFDHVSAIGQQIQLDLIPWPDTEMLRHVFSKRHLSPGGNGQCGRGVLVVV